MLDSQSEILPISVADEMSKSFLDYSMSVIISRALPDARDGLKPSQRRILFAMHELSLYPGKPHRKCAKICGDTSGNYHPHGEAVIYPTLVNMGQSWSMRERLVDPQGNFGSVEGDPPAAMRYTEARLTHLGGALMEDMEKDTVDFVPSYDEKLTEPTVFPAAFPNLLVNGGTGIAVGMATNIPPHNLGETVDALCAIIENPKLSNDELLQIMKGPDFPTGCTILGVSGIREYFETGRGSVKVRSEAVIEDLPNGREQIIVTEIPYAVNRATLVERIAQLVNEKILPEISAIRDESDENTRLVIELKREARAQVTLNRLYKLTALQTSFSINLLAIVERRPRLLTVREALDVYLEHRREVVLRRTRFLLGKAEARAEVLEAFLLALARIDEFIELIRSSKDRDQARARLQGYQFDLDFAKSLGILIRSQPSVVGPLYQFTERQVNAILELRLYQLTGLEHDKVKGEYEELLGTIEDLNDILARETRVLGIIQDELLALKAARATARKTRIEASADELAIEDLIANEAMVVTITNRGYIKRTLAREYQAQRRGGTGVRGMETRRAGQVSEEEADFVERLFSAHAHDYLMFFTDTGRVYVERVYEVPEGGRASRGRAIRNLLDLRAEEKVAAVLRVERIVNEAGTDITFSEQRQENVFFATADGTVKKTMLAEFRNYNKNGLIAIKIDEGNELISVRLTSGDDDIVLVTAQGQAMRFHEGDVRAMGRPSRGVRGIRLKEGRGDAVVGMALTSEDSEMLVASNQGLGKRTPFADYPRKNRGGQGVITMKLADPQAKVVRAVAVRPEQELVMITTGGQTVRIRAAEVRETGRSALGVRLIRLRGNEALQDLTAVDPEQAATEGLEPGDALADDASAEAPAAVAFPADGAAEVAEFETDASEEE